MAAEVFNKVMNNGPLNKVMNNGPLSVRRPFCI